MDVPNKLHSDTEAFEIKVDEYIKNLISNLAPFELLTLLFSNSYFFDQYQNDQSKDKKKNSRGNHIHNIGYLSGILKWTNKEVFKGTESYVKNSDRQKNANIFIELCSYAEFCQIFPNVHRNFYHSTVTKNELTLVHKSEDQSHLEALDMILSTLYNPQVSHLMNYEKSWFNSAAEGLFHNKDPVNYIHIIKSLYTKYKQHNLYLSPIDSKTLEDISEATLEDFHNFSSACYAICQYRLLLADAALEQMEIDEEKQKKIEIIIFNQIVVFEKKESLTKLISYISKVSLRKTQSLIKYFSTSLEKYRLSGEGFTPPFVEDGEDYIFNPVVVQRNISTRNILFHIQKNNKSLYEKKISITMEKTLVEHAEFYLKNLKNITTAKFHKWENGEIDILIYRDSDNTAIFIEAKAFLPPDSTRSVVRATERIINEAIDRQINRFKELPQSRKENILSSALGRPVKDIKIFYAILTWSSLGDHSVWKKYNDIIPINIPILAAICKKHSNSTLQKFPDHARELVSEIMQESQSKWEQVTQKIGPYEFTSPVLQYDQAAIAKFRKFWLPTKDAF